MFGRSDNLDSLCCVNFQGPTCTAWNCTCDKQIRAKRSTAALLGAMFVFSDISNDEEELECCKCFDFMSI